MRKARQDPGNVGDKAGVQHTLVLGLQDPEEAGSPLALQDEYAGGRDLGPGCRGEAGTDGEGGELGPSLPSG